MRLADIPDDKIVLIRWKDIVYFAFGMRPEDTVEDMIATADLEIVGKIKHIKRGVAVVSVEWPIMKHERYDDEGEAGRSTQLIPVGCIESVHELKVGKTLYKKPEPKESTEDGERVS